MRKETPFPKALLASYVLLYLAILAVWYRSWDIPLTPESLTSGQIILARFSPINFVLFGATVFGMLKSKKWAKHTALISCWVIAASTFIWAFAGGVFIGSETAFRYVTTVGGFLAAWALVNFLWTLFVKPTSTTPDQPLGITPG